MTNVFRLDNNPQRVEPPFYLENSWQQVRELLEQRCVAFIGQDKRGCGPGRQSGNLQSRFLANLLYSATNRKYPELQGLVIVPVGLPGPACTEQAFV